MRIQFFKCALIADMHALRRRSQSARNLVKRHRGAELRPAASSIVRCAHREALLLDSSVWVGDLESDIAAAAGSIAFVCEDVFAPIAAVRLLIAVVKRECCPSAPEPWICFSLSNRVCRRFVDEASCVQTL